MRSKELRQTRIRELLQVEDIETHGKLAEVLRRQGIAVSQSTLSKDLHELGVVRIPRPEGSFRYALPEAGATRRDRHILERELRDFLDSVDWAGNMVVLHTAPGHAQSVCEAIDCMEWPEIVGTLAGENTIFILVRTPQEAQTVIGRIAAGSGESF